MSSSLAASHAGFRPVATRIAIGSLTLLAFSVLLLAYRARGHYLAVCQRHRVRRQ